MFRLVVHSAKFCCIYGHICRDLRLVLRCVHQNGFLQYIHPPWITFSPPNTALLCQTPPVSVAARRCGGVSTKLHLYTTSAVSATYSAKHRWSIHDTLPRYWQSRRWLAEFIPRQSIRWWNIHQRSIHRRSIHAEWYFFGGN